MVIERPDGVEYRRAVLPDQGAGGRTMSIALNSAVPTGTWRARAFTDPKGSSVGETTFMVEDYIPERVEFTLSAKEKQIKAEVPVELKVDGRFLYGAPASGLQLEGDMLVTTAASGPAGLSRLPVRRGRRGDRQQRAHPDREPARSRRQWRGDLPGQPCQGRRPRRGRRRPRSSSAWRRPAAARSSASWCCRWRLTANLIGIKPLFQDKSVAEGDKAEFDVVFVAPDGKQLARSGLRYELMKIEFALSVVPAKFLLGI